MKVTDATGAEQEVLTQDEAKSLMVETVSKAVADALKQNVKEAQVNGTMKVDFEAKAKAFSNVIRDEFKTNSQRTSKALDLSGNGVLEPQWLTDIFMVPDIDGVMENIADVRTVGARTVNYRRAAQAVQIYRTDVGAKNQSSNGMTFSGANFTAHDYTAAVPLYESDIEDADFNVGAYVAQAAAKARSRLIDELAFTGETGTTPFAGLLNLTGANKIQLATGKGYNAITGWDFDALGYIVQHTAKKYKKPGNRWIWHPEVSWQFGLQKSTTGFYLANNLTQAGLAMRPMGYDYAESDLLPDVAAIAVSTPFGLFMDPKQLVVGQRLDMQARISYDAVLTNVDGTVSFSAAEENGAVIFFRFRLGMGVGTDAAVDILATTAS